MASAAGSACPGAFDPADATLCLWGGGREPGTNTSIGDPACALRRSANVVASRARDSVTFGKVPAGLGEASGSGHCGQQDVRLDQIVPPFPALGGGADVGHGTGDNGTRLPPRPPPPVQAARVVGCGIGSGTLGGGARPASHTVTRFRPDRFAP